MPKTKQKLENAFPTNVKNKKNGRSFKYLFTPDLHQVLTSLGSNHVKKFGELRFPVLPKS
jgi:hypothetical protein